jgi:hypothetical protein
MTRPRIYRDPIHGQIKYKRLNLLIPYSEVPKDVESQLGWLVPKLIDTREFQRLRHIRQNGLTNLVFHGAEHSRFSHSMGVAYLAREMYRRIAENMNEEEQGKLDSRNLLGTVAAALLHDVGHGPYSHSIEELLEEIDMPFNHEYMTHRIINEKGTETHSLLSEVDSEFPDFVASFINKTKPPEDKDSWFYKIVSSQLDADRLDYLLRDAKFAGLQGHGFDLFRLLDMLHRLDRERIGVDRHAIEAVEAFLIMLEQMYRAIYFHPGVRGATGLLKSVLKRATDLHREGKGNVFPRLASGSEHPFESLIENGQRIELNKYVALNEHHIWALIEDWRDSKDPTLADLATRLTVRKIFKAVDVEGWKVSSINELQHLIEQWVEAKVTSKSSALVKYYVVMDEPTRTSYKRYDWRGKNRDESIWMMGGDKEEIPIEDDSSEIIAGLKQPRHFRRLLFPHEVQQDVQDYLETIGRH